MNLYLQRLHDLSGLSRLSTRNLIRLLRSLRETRGMYNTDVGVAARLEAFDRLLERL